MKNFKTFSLSLVLGVALIITAFAQMAHAAAGEMMEVRVISSSPAQVIGERAPVTLYEKLRANGWSNGDIALLRTQIGVILKAALELEAKILALEE